MRSDNSIIQGFWIGDELGPMETLCITSYLKNGHDFHLFIYDDVRNIPLGTTIQDAGSILDKSKIYRDPFGGYVNISNQFRYEMLYQLGGWWVDLDTVCLKPFDLEGEYVFSSEYSAPYDRFLINTTYIKSPPGARYLKECLHFLEKRGHANIHWGELGVNLFSRMVLRNELGRFVKAPEVFCPISPYHFDLIITDNNNDIPDSSYAIHWWSEIWKLRGISKGRSFKPNSIYDKVRSLYV